MVAKALIPVRVARKAGKATGIASVDLVAANGTASPLFGAGAHVDVRLRAGLVRQSSRCNAPTGTAHDRVAVLHHAALRGGSRARHQAAAVGQVLQISAPRSVFGLAIGARRHLLPAGVIGVTPMLVMAAQLATAGADVALHGCTRSPHRTAFVGALRRRCFVPQVQPQFDDGGLAQRLNLPALLGTPQAGMPACVCGSEGLIDTVLATARAAAWPDAQLHTESFGAAPAALVQDSGLDVQRTSSGRALPLRDGQTVAAALASAGLDVATACDQGICGSCLTRVLAGEIEYHDHDHDHDRDRDRDHDLLADEQAAMDSFFALLLTRIVRQPGAGLVSPPCLPARACAKTRAARGNAQS